MKEQNEVGIDEIEDLENFLKDLNDSLFHSDYFRKLILCFDNLEDLEAFVVKDHNETVSVLKNAEKRLENLKTKANHMRDCKEKDMNEFNSDEISDAGLNHTIKYLQDITDYIDAWESQISLKNSDFDIVCLKAYVQAKIDILKKERDGNHAN